jgi:hypothetical protein
MPLPLPEKIEVKLAIEPEDTKTAFDLLGLSDPPKEEKRIHFFDTQGLSLFDRDLILRVRQTVSGNDEDDVTLKVRGPGAELAAERFLDIEGDKAKFEGDQNVGKDEQPSFSITTKPGSALLADIVAGKKPFAMALDEAGRALLQEMAGADAGKIVVLGPIRSRTWKLKPDGFDGKISAELWDVAGTQLLEVSDKTPRDGAGVLAGKLSKLFQGSGVRQLATSKTGFALERLRPKAAS